MSTNLVIPASDLQALKAAGFTPPTPKPLKPPRITIASEGKTKNGKTHFAVMTPPDPLAYIMLDPGALQLADKAIARGRKILSKYIAHSKKESQDEAKKLWQEYRASIRAVMGAKNIRTLVIDTIDEAWELLQMAEFGKLKQNNKFAYGALNAEFSGLIDEVYYGRPDLNVIYIRRVKKLYVNTKKANGDDESGWDGKSMEPKGYKDLDYMVDMSIVHSFKGGQFQFETKTSEATRFGGEYSGLTFIGDECSFPELAMYIFKDAETSKALGFQDGSDPELWGISL